MKGGRGRSSAGRVAIVLALLVGLALVQPAPRAAATASYQTHSPIDIESDSDWTSANGVVSGNGSPGSPFVIAGWSITTSTGVAISITNVTKAWVVSNNSIRAGVGVQLGSQSVVGAIRDNLFITMGTAVSVSNTDALIVNNSFGGDITLGGQNIGISLTNSNSVVVGNRFVYTPWAIIATQGSPVIRCNDIHDDTVLAGISVRFTTNATIECNTLTSCSTGIVSSNAIGTVIANNSIVECLLGIDLYLTKDATVVNNTVEATFGLQVRAWHTSGNFSSNVVVDGHADAVLMIQSPMVVWNNTISDNIGVGLWLQSTAAQVTANVLSHNAVGIFLDQQSVSYLTANVMTNNTVGIDIPYSSRQAIVHLQGNFVNGVNIDGTVVASEQVFYYQAANVVISGGLRDSGFSAGYYGSLTAEGNVVLYEVDNALVDATVISHANFGVTAINAFNVVVHDSVITDTIVGVEAQATVTGTQVPPCAVSVKNTTINVTVDPIGTIGVDAHACIVNVRNSTIATVDTGIRFDAASHGEIRGNLIASATIGMDIQASASTTVTANTVTLGTIGMRFSGSKALVTDNVVTQLIVGVQLTGGANLTFQRNNVTLSARGVVDLGPCGNTPSTQYCGSVVAKGNVIASNDGDGLRLNGTSSFDGDVFANNGGTGAQLASASLVRVDASMNGGDGVDVSGTFSVRDSTFFRNGQNGLGLSGQGDVRRSHATFNDAAGIHTNAAYVLILDSEFSHNLDGIAFDDVAVLSPLPSLSTTALLRALPSAQGSDTMDVHRTAIVANERDGIRAGFLEVNATYDYWGGSAPAISVQDSVGAFQNGVSPLVRFLPWYADPGMTQTGPVPGL